MPFPMPDVMAVEPSDYSAQGTGPQFAGSDPIPLISDTVTAFIGRTQRGPINEPVPLESFEAYRRIFGGHGTLGFLSYSVQQYFDHGGQRAVVVRVTNRAVRATLELPAADSVLRLQAREPGCHDFLRASVDYDGIGDSEDRFNLVVQRLIRPGSQLVEDQELFTRVSMDKADDRFVVDVLRLSRLVRLSGPVPVARPDATEATRPGEPIPYVERTTPGSDGDELTDYDIIGSNEERTGLFALDAVENLDLVCIPSLSSRRELGITTFLAVERYCKKRQAILIWDPPWAWTSPETVLIGMRDSGLASQNAMTYFPRIRIRESADRYPNGVPACGAVAGILARNDDTGIWRDFQEGNNRLRPGISALVDVGPRQAEMLCAQGVNVIASKKEGPLALHGDVSLAGSTALTRLWQRLDRRRLTYFILRMIQRHSRWAWAEEQNDRVAAALDLQVGGFLNELFQRGALAGQHPQQAYSFRAGSRSEDGELVLRVGLALERPSEFQIYEVTHRAEGSESRAVPPMEAAQLAG